MRFPDIWKTRKLRFSVIALLLMGLSLTLAIMSVSKISTERVSQEPLTTVIREAPQPAAEFIYSSSPFYFPFKRRGTSMPANSPFSQDFSAIGRLNSQGFRTPEYTTAHPDNTYRILVIGDGYTWGVNVQLEETFPYILGKLLNYKCSEFQTEVIALGVFGHRFADKTIQLLVQGPSLKPDLVIFQITPYDVDFFNYWTIFHAQKILNEAEAYNKKLSEVMDDHSLDWEVFSESLEEIEKWSQKESVSVAFVAFPLIDTRKDGRNFDHYDVMAFPSYPQLTSFEKMIMKIRNHGFPILYLLDTFSQRAQDRYIAISANNPFPNSYAHRLVAEAISSFLNQNRLFRCSASELPPPDPKWKEERLLRLEAAEKWLDFNTNFRNQLLFYQKLQKLYPKDPWITWHLADTYLHLRFWHDAFNAYSSLVDFVPDLAAPWYHMAVAGVGAQGRKKLLQRMLEVVPDHTQAMQDLVSIYLEEKNVTDACRLISRLMQIPSYTALYDTSKQLFEKNKCNQVLSQSSLEATN